MRNYFFYLKTVWDVSAIKSIVVRNLFLAHSVKDDHGGDMLSKSWVSDFFFNI